MKRVISLALAGLLLAGCTGTPSGSSIRPATVPSEISTTPESTNTPKCY